MQIDGGAGYHPPEVGVDPVDGNTVCPVRVKGAIRVFQRAPWFNGHPGLILSHYFNYLFVNSC